MDKLYRKLFRRRSNKQPQVQMDEATEDSAATDHGPDQSEPRDEATGSGSKDLLDHEDAGPRRNGDRAHKLPCKGPQKSKRGKKPSRPLDPYVPPFVTAAAAGHGARGGHRCVCGCGCDKEAACDWRPDRKKLSKCSGIVATVISAAAAAASDTDSEEERDSAVVEHRRNQQWYKFQMANGTESAGYRLSPR